MRAGTQLALYIDVSPVQTDNLGFMTGEGFEIVGRWKKRPGSLDAEAIKGGHGGKILTSLISLLLKKNLRKVGSLYKKLSKDAGRPRKRS